jgi:hypothetical protein
MAMIAILGIVGVATDLFNLFLVLPLLSPSLPPPIVVVVVLPNWLYYYILLLLVLLPLLTVVLLTKRSAIS